ncbi:uncharacterized protein EI90DRAFT_3016409 [Cantharellus anzutake]|uniref:uncharacterized protein n=1 Tax=Cantharellus anzutake TaxID=1750568 RepID=UPI001907E346|nr:uncharacterized protein EI90DRAFT_3016409 [Cantharellus anzutake]KAF8331415.1 hypothetical protein EI90DRAFT_3016409 [Cantharellus anzutake]
MDSLLRLGGLSSSSSYLALLCTGLGLSLAAVSCDSCMGSESSSEVGKLKLGPGGLSSLNLNSTLISNTTAQVGVAMIGMRMGLGSTLDDKLMLRPGGLSSFGLSLMHSGWGVRAGDAAMLGIVQW